jgi:CheY-like chemotaxis protein
VLAKRMFASLGLEVVVAPDGEAGVEAYAAAMQADDRFDVVLLDLTIPGGMGGQEAVKALLALDPEAVCVATSGYSNDPVLAHFEDYGFHGRLAKPYDRDAAAKMLASVWTGAVGTPLPAGVRR